MANLKHMALTALDIIWRIWVTSVVVLFLLGYIGITRGTSMAPTLADGEVHIYSRYSEPEVGDIVMLSAYGGEKVLVKRIAAGPGEQVEYQGEVLTLGEGEFFVLGDNVDFSVDSRCFGAVQGEDILGVLVI